MTGLYSSWFKILGFSIHPGHGSLLRI